MTYPLEKKEEKKIKMSSANFVTQNAIKAVKIARSKLPLIVICNSEEHKEKVTPPSYYKTRFEFQRSNYEYLEEIKSLGWGIQPTLDQNAVFWAVEIIR